MPDQPLRHVQVGRKVIRRERINFRSGFSASAAASVFEQVHRGRVGADHLVRAGADQTGDLAADARWRIDPVARRPSPDEHASPLFLNDLLHALDGALRRWTEGVAVQVDEIVGVYEKERESAPADRRRRAR